MCPKSDLSFALPTCDISTLHASLFVPKSWAVPTIFRALGLPVTVTFAPVYIHAVATAVFTSLVAPFGGFLASGVKRAFRIKDFGDYIPGHGGATDRMDCQFLAGTCARPCEGAAGFGAIRTRARAWLCEDGWCAHPFRAAAAIGGW